MRTITRRGIGVATLVLLVLPLTSYAQKTKRKQNNVSPNSATAILLLDSAASDLKKVENLEERISLAENIARMLAGRRPERTRQMLDSLFDDALKQLRAESPANAFKRQSAESQIWTIVRIAGSFDTQLAKSYIEKYTEKEISEEDSEKRVQASGLSRGELYLRLATEMIERNPGLAISLAGNVIKREVPNEILVFLGTLRKKDIGLANSFFLTALQSVKARGGKDINELLLLYSYALSPLQVPQVRAEGLVLLQLPRYRNVSEPYPEDPTVATQFLNIAVQLLLDQLRYNPDQYEQLATGPSGDFFFLTVIEPHVAKYLPALVQSLINQRMRLSGYLRTEQRSELQAQTDRWNNLHSRAGASSANALNTTDYFLKWAEETANPKQRDQLYCRASIAAVKEKRFDYALEIVGKISSEFREESKQYVLFQIAMAVARDRQLEKAEQMARRDEDLVRRAYLFTLIAKSIVDDKTQDINQARFLLDEAERLAAKLGNDRERLSIMIGSAAVYSIFDTVRGAEVFRAAIKIANKTPGFSGDTYIARNLDIAGFYFDYSMYVQEFTFSEAINRLGLADFNETLFVIQELKDDLVRLKATVAICNAVLSKESA